MSNCVINVCGGVGNQLFQIATGYAYSKKYGKKLIINGQQWHGSQGVHSLKYKDTLFKNFEYGDVDSATPINEIESNYNEIPFIEGDVSLNGYFQSLRYFEDCKEEFINLLNFPNVDRSIIQKKNVAFHIRRGDYRMTDILYICKTKYFSDLFQKFEGYNIHVFTDSPKHVLEEFKDYDFKLIQTSSELNDLTLMSYYDNLVCSNSTFSWWASILNKEKYQIIVPYKWFNDRECGDIYYDGMIKYEF